MGYELTRFTGEVDDELVCTICSGVLEDPLQVPGCEHVFCTLCIFEWIDHQPTCPVDRRTVTSAQLQPIPRILRNFLSKLTISCDHASHGCTAVLKLDALPSHSADCEYNPPIQCDAGCGLTIPKGEIAGHNCVRELRALLEIQQESIMLLEQEKAAQSFSIEQLQAKLATQEANHKKLQQKVADQSSTINREQAMLAMQETKHTNILQKVADQSSTIKQEKAMLEMQEANHKRLQQKVAEQSSTIERVQEKLETQDANHEKLQQIVADLCSNIKRELLLITTQQIKLRWFQKTLIEIIRPYLLNKSIQPLVLNTPNTLGTKLAMLMKTEDPLGITISQHRCGCIFITGIKEGSPAANIPHIQVGDYIMDINNAVVFRKELSEVIEDIKKIPKGNEFPIRLTSILVPNLLGFELTLSF